MEAMVHDAAARNAKRGWRSRLATAFGMSGAAITKMVQKTCNPASDRQVSHALRRIGLDHRITTVNPADLLGGKWEEHLRPGAGDVVARTAVAEAFDLAAKCLEVAPGPSEPLTLTSDPEARAIDALSELPPDARARVLAYARERWSK
jgi:hypothetical protein